MNKVGEHEIGYLQKIIHYKELEVLTLADLTKRIDHIKIKMYYLQTKFKEPKNVFKNIDKM